MYAGMYVTSVCRRNDLDAGKSTYVVHIREYPGRYDVLSSVFVSSRRVCTLFLWAFVTWNERQRSKKNRSFCIALALSRVVLTFKR